MSLLNLDLREQRPCEWCMAAPATCYVFNTRCCDGCKVNRQTRVTMALQRWKRAAKA